MRSKALFTLLSAVLVFGSLGFVSGEDDGKCVEGLRDVVGAYKLDLPGPVNYADAEQLCHGRGMALLYPPANPISAVERSLCGDQFVPLDNSSKVEWEALKALYEETPSDDTSYDTPVANLQSGRWSYVNASQEFDCVLCQHEDVSYPFGGDVVNVEDVTMSEHFVAHVVSTAISDTAAVGEVWKDALRDALNEVLKPVFGLDNITFARAWLDQTRHLHADFRVDDCIALSVVMGEATSSILNGSFVLGVEDLGTCPTGETVDGEGVVSKWSATTAGAIVYVTDASSRVTTSRECWFNKDIGRAEWHPLLSRWTLVWRPCSPDEQYVNEELYKQFLDAVDVDRRHANVLQELASTPVNTTTLQEVARLVSREIFGRNELCEQTERHLVNITAHLVMDSGSDHAVATAGRADLIVADLEGSEPVMGFTLACELNVEFAVDNVTVDRNRTVEGRALFALDVSARLAEAHSRMAFVVVWKILPHFAEFHDNSKEHQYIEVTVMFPRQGEVSRWAFASYGNHHVDLTYDANTTQTDHDDGDFGEYLVCVAWSTDLRQWTREGCKALYNGTFSACRCSGKYFVLQDGVPIAKFALKRGSAQHRSSLRNNIFTDFLKDKAALMTATAIECLLSLLGLGSIIGTAILFKQWRENAGHKILLHMVLALTCNLVLGFATSFVRMTTEGVGCLLYGVLRHYSFLAMFFWMLVLSLLQMKRLMTVAGAKATTHLVLKAAVFAWGVPLVLIVVLLSVNPGFYQTDRFERGYCYPEGLVFQVTVQAPAGLILFVNLGIFINIILHIFGCVGEKKISRHSKNEKAEQLNKLKTSLFIFFLFGFTWVFHILSEERVIVSDFLFEYLFLMTATTHIFVLALFFVVFQESTRKNWIIAIKKMVGKS